jgi:hypothetical protein
MYVLSARAAKMHKGLPEILALILFNLVESLAGLFAKGVATIL